jgi:lipoate-protein ligase A
MTSWRLYLDRARSGAENMALDEALMGRARRTGEIVVRVYAWETPTLSLGRNQAARDRYDLARAAERGVGFVRRPTGGRAVLHHREITYSVTAPADALGTLPESYARINRLLVEALRALGAPAEIAQPAGAVMPPGVAPCFELPAPGEITARGRKLVGSAQRRDDAALLQHGSILVDDDQKLSAELLLERHAAPPSAATLRELTGGAPSLDEAARCFGNAIASLEDPGVARLVMDAETTSEAVRLRVCYDDPAWTWRR